MELPYNGRAIVNDNFGSIEIIIPAKKNWFIMLFACAWLGMCIFILSSSGILSIPDKHLPPFFMIAWSTGCLVGAVFVFRVLFWMLTGKEIITVEPGQLTIDKKGVLFYRRTAYDLHESQNFRALEDIPDYGWNNRKSNPAIYGKGGTIRFDYGMKTVKFGVSLDEAEAAYIIKLLADKQFIK